MIPWFVFLFFFIVFFIPFIPAIIELLRPRDALPLVIPMNYSKDPRYFGRSFRNILRDSLVDIRPGIIEIKLSKNEEIEITYSKKIGIGERIDHILYIIGDLVSEENARFSKEVYVRGDAYIGSDNALRAIAVDGNLNISRRVSLLRWADAEGKVDVYEDCNLGISITSEDEIRIRKGCRFKRLYGLPIITFSIDNNPIPCLAKEDISNKTWVIDRDRTIIPPFTRIDKDLIVKKDLIVRKGCILVGSIKTYGNLILEEDINIIGNLFSEKDIEIGDNCTITGDAFSQGKITVKEKVRIGRAGTVKSVIGKEGIILSQGVIIYGYVMTEGLGMVI